jgi:hypothetical protein
VIIENIIPLLELIQFLQYGNGNNNVVFLEVVYAMVIMQ